MGTFGGKVNFGENFEYAAKRELKEETGYSAVIRLIPAFLYEEKNFQYQNFIGVVSEEFTPKLSWETEDFAWCNYQELREIEPKHFGLDALLENSGNLINKAVK